VENEAVFATLTIAVQVPGAIGGGVQDQIEFLDNDISFGNLLPGANAQQALAQIQPFIDGSLADAPDPIPAGQVVAQGNNGGTSIARLREGIERFLITDINNPAGSSMAQSEIALMWDHIEGAQLSDEGVGRINRFNHVPGGSNVLYLDGHVEFLRYPADKHPVTRVNAILGAGL
jgi:prepilin-type processing-associated H-X9-DG protein